MTITYSTRAHASNYTRKVKKITNRPVRLPLLYILSFITPKQHIKDTQNNTNIQKKVSKKQKKHLYCISYG